MEMTSKAKVELPVNLGGLKMPASVTTVSGTFGYGTEYLGAVEYSEVGAVTAKGFWLDSWPAGESDGMAVCPVAGKQVYSLRW